MCLKVHWNHETPNQSLNCGTLGKRRRLWVQLPASLCSKAGNSDSDVDSPITQAFRDGCFTIPWLEALHGLSWRLVPKPTLSKPQAECHYRLSGVSRSWPTFTITVSASPAFHVAQWMLRVLYLQYSKPTAPNWFCSMPNRTMSDWESPWALSHHSPFPTPRLFVGRSNTAQSEDIQIVAHRFLQCHRRGCALERTTHLMCYELFEIWTADAFDGLHILAQVCCLATQVCCGAQEI